MMSQMNGPARFRQLLAKPGYIMAMGVWDPLSARVCESMGLECVHIGGYQTGVASAISEPLMTLTELATICHYTTAAVKIPVFVDAGTGFGEALHVMRTVKELERTGIAGLHIEDQIFPKRAHYHKGVEHVVSRSEMVDKIKCALAARTNPDFVIMGRTDSMATDGFKEGVERANLYLEAGAEMVQIFPNNEEEARLAPKEINGPCVFVVSEGNRLKRPIFSTQEFEDMGYKMGTYPTQLLCPVVQEMKRVLANFKSTGRSGLDHDKMILWRKECEDLIGLDEYYRIESATVEY
ncbi:oxaloacetate decarboxylase [Chloroflexota bacterium]